MILVDTSVLIDHLRGDHSARAALRRGLSEGETLAASVLTKIEVLAGMRASEEPATRRLLDNLRWIAVDERLAERAGMLANRFLRTHPGIDPVDYVIAATALSTGSRLWTRNVRHFPMFPDLQSPY